MAWQSIVGHDTIVDRFRIALRKQRLASSFLFVGPEGVGKWTFALALAKSMLCPNSPEQDLAACGHCSSCVQAAAGTHPDILRVAKPEDKSTLPLELLIGDADHRMRRGLCYEIGLKPFLGARRFAVIDDADFLNEAGANSLLKTLEEPPPGSLLILISTSLQRQLPTIRSRCQVVRFAPLPPESIAQLLLESDATADPQQALAAARTSEGGVAAAFAALEASEACDRGPLLATLTRRPLRIATLEAALEAFGKPESGKKLAGQAARDLARQALLACADLYRQWLRDVSDSAPLDDLELQDYVATGSKQCQLSANQVIQCLERVLEAQRQVDRNAYAKLWPLSLASDLASIYEGRPITFGVGT